ncbi:MAG TPA: hypothetical protein VML50_19045 [Anaeromyxobacter sp.]|nr:hypothetical protein [Anaeromyxobacter sp.]
MILRAGRTSLALRAAAVMAAAALACASDAERRSSPAPDSAAPAPASADLARALEPIEDLDPDAYVAVAPEELGALRADLEGWWRRLFRPEASPARSQGVRQSARASAAGAPDLVRSEYDMAVVRVEVIDAARFALVRIADPGVDVADGAVAQVMARRLLAAGEDRRWELRLPERLAEGEWYASEATGSAGASGDRVDVRVRGGRLELLCAKRGEERPAPDAWFPAALRAELGAAPAPDAQGR